MGWYTAPSPKTKLTKHQKECGNGEWLRKQWADTAEAPCLICSKPIGYDTAYMIADVVEGNATMEHAACVWKREEAEQKARVAHA